MSNRIERINAELKKQLSPIISNDLKDPRVKGLISIVKVDTDNDLSTCKVYLSILGADGDEKEVVKAVNNAEGFIKSILKSKIQLRCLPELRFILDDSISYGIKIESILQNLKTDKSEE